jgi:N-acetylneuraminic acid mutarotase
VFFEASVANYQALVKGLAAGTDAVVLDSGGDGLKEMTAFLASRHGLTAIGLVAHGAPGALALGTLTLGEQDLEVRAHDLAALGSALSPGGEIDLWSCDVAAGKEGASFVQKLAAAAGAGVAAAAHAVGATDMGGAWQLDVQAAGARGENPFSAEALRAFHGLMGTWLATPPMASPRWSYTAFATLLPSGNVLAAGGTDWATSLALSSAELYNPASGSWSPAASMSTTRTNFTITPLNNGKVLVTGGQTDASGLLGALSSAILYDPASNTWSSAGSMATARYNHTATLLSNGKVLVTGGNDNNDVAQSSAELYDPATNTWSKAGSMGAARAYQTATLLTSGKVLVTGGTSNTGSELRSAEIYDPVSNTWSSANFMATARYYHTATLLGTGKVLVIGGDNMGPLSSAEVYDPVSNSWSSAGSMATSRYLQTATLLNNGKVLVTGGFSLPNNNPTALSSTELYDPTSNSWSADATMATGRYAHTAILLASGKVLVVGGSSDHTTVASAELYDPNAIDPSQSTVTVVPATIPVGGAATITVTARDSAGHQIPNGGLSFSVGLSSGSGAFSHLTDNQNGTYSATFTGTEPGLVTIAATLDGKAITGAPPTITVLSAGKLIVSLPGGNATAAGTSFIIEVQAADELGNPIPPAPYGGSNSVTITATPADPLGNLPITGTLNSNGLGFFQGTLNAAGSYTLSATAGSLTGTSSSLTVTPSQASYFTVAAPATATPGSPLNVTVTALDRFGNIATGYSGHVHFTSSDAGAILPVDATLSGGQGAFSVTLKATGSQTVTATDSSLTNPMITGTSNAIRTRGLTVTTFTPTPTGFSAVFSKPFNVASLALYGTGLHPPQAVALVGAKNGPINGSLIVDPANMGITFKATTNSMLLANGLASAALPDDTYTAIFRSGTGSNGFVDALGASLDGGNNGGQANFTTTFTTHYQGNATPVLSIPDFARGPDNGHTVKVPNDTGLGIPVTLYSGTKVTDLTFTLSYDPSLINITAGFSGANSDATDPAGSFTLTAPPTIIDATHAQASFHFSDNAPQSLTIVLGDIRATVPNSAADKYKATELLQPGNVVINQGAVGGAVTAPGVHVNAYFGDVTGNGAIDGFDVATALNVAQGRDTGFGAYRLLDPAVVGDLALDNSVDAGAFSDLAAYTVHLAVPALPPIPKGMVDQANTGAVSSSISIDGSAPIGQEFVPSLSAIDFVQLYLHHLSAGDGLSNSVAVRIHSDTISGPVLGTSQSVTVGDRSFGAEGIVTFTFPSPVTLTPGKTYVIELIDLHGPGNVEGLEYTPSPSYGRGRAIVAGNPDSTLDFYFSVGLSALTITPVSP